MLSHLSLGPAFAVEVVEQEGLCLTDSPSQDGGGGAATTILADDGCGEVGS